jgi:hypothetical protein
MRSGAYLLVGFVVLAIGILVLLSYPKREYLDTPTAKDKDDIALTRIEKTVAKMKKKMDGSGKVVDQQKAEGKRKYGDPDDLNADNLADTDNNDE